VPLAAMTGLTSSRPASLTLISGLTGGDLPFWPLDS
jgi:hypothetical protein